MFEIKNFNNWIEDKGSGKFGSGASEKVWLINPETDEKGIFKFPKIKNKEKGIVTGEYWAEKLASEIGKLINVECAKVEIGTYMGRIGSMSYNIISDKIIAFVEGVEFILAEYPYYDKDKLQDPFTNTQYSIQMIQKSIAHLIDFKDFLKVVIFDVLIGNSDRHHSNWGIKYEINDNDINVGICPLYDNGSSLCAYENNNDLSIFFKDKMKFEALVNTKSKSAIGWDNKRPIRQFELLEKIKENYYNDTIEYIKLIRDNINEKNINDILENFDNDIINEDMKKLLKMYLLERRKRMLKIYDLKDGV